MESLPIIQMILAALGAVGIYILIGFIPGTDETSVLMPITLAVVLAGIKPVIVLTFFIAAIVTLNLTNAIPAVLIGLPGGVMSSPMMEYSLLLKEKGLSAQAIKKMAVGSLLGTIISIPTALIVANVLVPYAGYIQEFAPLLLFLGAVFLSLMDENKILALFSIILMSMLFMGLRYLYWGIGNVSQDREITTSFFLGISIGPLAVSLLTLLNKEGLQSAKVEDKKDVLIPKKNAVGEILSPFKLLSKSKMRKASISAFISSLFFMLSPVGLTILFGEIAASKEKSSKEKALTAIISMSAIAQATYLSGIIIPLMALGIPLSPTAIGPGAALFNAPPIFTTEKNLHHLLSRKEFVVAILVGATIASIITYLIINRFAEDISLFVLEKIPHEAVIGLFISLVLLLSYMDAGFLNIFGVILIGLTCGTLNRLGVGYGVQFMTLYASSWIIEKLAPF